MFGLRVGTCSLHSGRTSNRPEDPSPKAMTGPLLAELSMALRRRTKWKAPEDLALVLQRQSLPMEGLHMTEEIVVAIAESLGARLHRAGVNDSSMHRRMSSTLMTLQVRLRPKCFLASWLRARIFGPMLLANVLAARWSVSVVAGSHSKSVPKLRVVVKGLGAVTTGQDRSRWGLSTAECLL